MDRRALLTTTGALTVSSLAGCLGLTSVTEDEPKVPMDATLSGWPTYRGDVQRTGRASAGPSDPSGLDAKWRVTGESTYHAHLAAAAGYVFTDAEGLHVIDGETGDVVAEALPADHEIATPPVVQDGTLYFGTGTARVVAADAHTGTIRWTYDATEGDNLDEIPHGVRATPTRHASGLFIGVPDVERRSGDGGLGRGGIHCIAADASSADDRCWPGWQMTTHRIGRALLAVEDTLFVAAGPILYAYDVTEGTRRWKRSVGAAGSPLSDGERVVLPVADGGLAAFAADSGEQVWHRDFEGPAAGRLRIVNEPAITDANVVVVGSSDGTLKGLSSVSGETRWTVTPPETVGYWSAPAIDGTTAYVAANGLRDVDRTTRADPQKGWLYAVDTETGSVTWSTAEAGWANSPIVCSGGVIASMGLDVVRYE